MTMLWLDDLREPPNPDWTWVKTVGEARRLLRDGHVEAASLDNDLGLDEPEGRTLVLWMAEHDIWPENELTIHSANPVAVEYMTGVIERYAPFDRAERTGTKFVRWRPDNLAD